MDNLTKGALGATIVVMLGAIGFAVSNTVKNNQIERENLALREQIQSDQRKREDDKTAALERELEEAKEALDARKLAEERTNAKIEELRAQMLAEQQERLVSEAERQQLSATIAEKIRKEEEVVGSGALTELQKKIREAASIGKVDQVHEELGFVIVAAGSSNGVQPDQRYNIRRDRFLVGEIVISSVEDEKNSVGNIVAGSTQPGLEIRPGDEVIGQIY